jgi:integrase
VQKLKLTDRSVQAVKPVAEMTIIYDTHLPGLALRCMPSGHKSFIFVGRFPPSSNPTRRSLGAYEPAVGVEPELPEDELLALNVLSLGQARAKAQAWRRLIQRGLDPEKELERRRTEREATERRLAADIFEPVARRFLAEHMASKRTAKDVERLFENRLMGPWGTRPIATITRRDVIDRVSEIRRTVGNEAARQALAYIKLFFAWAMELDIVSASPCPTLKTGKKSKLLAPKQSRKRVLSDDEIRLIWQATDDDTLAGYPAAPFVRLLLILGCRRSELSRSRWREFELLKPGDETFMLKGDRTKSGEPRLIPLPGMAVQIISSLPKFAGGDFLFAALGGRKPFTSFSKAKQRLDAKIAKLNGGVALHQWGLHDLRRTMRTRLSALKIEHHVRELMIGHAQEGIVPVYDLHAYQDEQRDGFEEWCARLREIVKPPRRAARKKKQHESNVLPFQRVS